MGYRCGSAILTFSYSMNMVEISGPQPLIVIGLLSYTMSVNEDHPYPMEQYEIFN